ncbi:Piso0_002207 [Millerozyma farinosa CBS 7064]|uniref:Piso0_002207 protein n=1 Tax=Pichia sorbitophila (strain ATCC MYA-4447 / BCRC 22081 / CBS 7064 / NBRC 10061 / NRRL Y-12695) TaxID=559304 RepID=G8YBZ9_PICSO|nr:Piso0_002207 [Millerozyma farinosa CBS 7064]
MSKQIREEKETQHDNQKDVAGINDLPREILIKIFSNLDTLELVKLKLVCKDWALAVSDETTWVNSFKKNLGTGRVFPSVSGSSTWMVEYMTRVKTARKWKKAIAVHKSFQLFNDEYGLVDLALVSFAQEKLLTFSRIHGDISICNVLNGRHQTFIPGNVQFGQISSYALNWSYLFIGNRNGEVFSKNLMTSTSSSSARTSILKFDVEEHLRNIEVWDLAISPRLDKFKQRIDFIAAYKNGELVCWNSNGKRVKSIHFDDSLIRIKSDFHKYIIVVGWKKLYKVDYATFNITEFNHDVDIENKERCVIDFDYGSTSVILSYENIIRCFTFDASNIERRELILPYNVHSVKGVVQTAPRTRTHNRETYLAGGDGLLYANILSDDSILVWNIRDNEAKITPQCQIFPSFSKHHPRIPDEYPVITCVALNASIVAVGGYNGFTNIYDAYTGEYLREGSIKFPKKMSRMYEHVVPNSKIILNEDSLATNGVTLCGDVAQYFLFGENNQESNASKKSKLSLAHSSSKNPVHQSIRDQIDDYDHLQETENRRRRLFEKYNGASFDNDEDELTTALAISESYHQVSLPSTQTPPLSSNESDPDYQLQLALELSKSEQTTDKDLEEILRLSLEEK